jgi:hypothetical protein
VPFAEDVVDQAIQGGDVTGRSKRAAARSAAW